MMVLQFCKWLLQLPLVNFLRSRPRWDVSKHYSGFTTMPNIAESKKSMSRLLDNDIVSAANVLVTTFWIFLLPQAKGLMGHLMFCSMFLWVATK